MKLQNYSLNVKYWPNKELLIPDMFSRAPIKSESKKLQEEFELNVIQVLPVAKTKFDKHRQEMQNVPTL